MEVEGRCRNMCPPGEFLKELYTEQNGTVCSPCETGSYSSEYTMFGKCEKCLSCPQEYVEKCTATTNAKCRCSSGFLCSNNVCSSCVENKCVTGERPNKTVIAKSLVDGFEEYSYHCEPICPDNSYYERKDAVCKLRTQCAIIGLAELFPGNKTHNSVCDRGVSFINDGGIIHMIVGIGFVLVSLTLLVLLSYACMKKLIKHKPKNNPINVVAVSANTSEYHLSKEESGCQLIIQDESKHSDSLGHLNLENVSLF
ncbi:tumor necrosis factor receptor superfamily member 18 [Sparus aurata]|uniref:tumor necrosis factor receptor superfamily member 18 n=1 Tax=Sparus aurata TaxID=8175 RepID=UPI0011C1A50E|nr:tumor necrosis factor receptor superfamily member 3-like [Sparus aurata]